MEQAIETITRRVNELGVTEPSVTRHGGRDRIEVQLPGIREIERAKQIIRATAQLRLVLVEQGPFASLTEARQAYGGARRQP